MKKRAWLVAFLSACGGARATTTIQSPQDYERVVVHVVDRVIEIFRDGGINCNMVSNDLRSLDGSQKMDAARTWRKDHPEATETIKTVVAKRKVELERVMAPTARQCGGPIQRLVNDLTQ